MTVQVGSAFNGEHLDLPNGSYIDIRPDPRREVVIHVFAYTGAVEFYQFNGTRLVKIDYDTSAGDWPDCSFMITNESYMKIKNVSGGNIDVIWQGVYTK